MYNDYIMRIIEQFIQSLMAIINSRKSGDNKKAMELIQTASRFYLGNEISSFILMTPSQILDQFKNDAERSIICADLLYELGMVCQADQNSVAASRLKILSLQLYLNIVSKELRFQSQEYFDKVDNLLNELKEEHLPDEVKLSLNSYAKKQGFLRKT